MLDTILLKLDSIKERYLFLEKELSNSEIVNNHQLYANYSKEILKLTNKPVSCEVFADDVKNMQLQGNIISKWGKNVYVKHI